MVDDRYEASGLAGAQFFEPKRALVLIGIPGFRIRRRGRPMPICIFYCSMHVREGTDAGPGAFGSMGKP